MGYYTPKYTAPSGASAAAIVSCRNNNAAESTKQAEASWAMAQKQAILSAANS